MFLQAAAVNMLTLLEAEGSGERPSNTIEADVRSAVYQTAARLVGGRETSCHRAGAAAVCQCPLLAHTPMHVPLTCLLSSLPTLASSRDWEVYNQLQEMYKEAAGVGQRECAQCLFGCSLCSS